MNPEPASQAKPSRWRWRRQHAVAKSLPLLTVALSILLLLSGWLHLPPGGARTAAIAVGVVGGVILLGIAAVLATADVQQRSHLIAAGLIITVAVLLAVIMAIGRQLTQTADLQLLIVIAGAFLVAQPGFVAALAGTWAAWLVAALVIRAPVGESLTWALAMIGATAVAVVLHTVRQDSMRDLGTALAAAETQSVHDPVTGLLNRRGMDLLLSELLALARRTREPLSCTYLHTDGLAQLAEAGAAEQADAATTVVGDALRTVFRESDVITRWTDTDFVVLALGAGPRVEEVERRLLDRLLREELAVTDWTPDICAGRVVHLPWQHEAVERIIERAEQEMHRRRTVKRAKVGDEGAHR